MANHRRLLGSALTGRLLTWGAVLAFETAGLRLVYPVAIVLTEQAWAALAVAIATLSISLSLLRGWTIDRVTRIVRTSLFDSVSEAIAAYPALVPTGSPPIEQLETEIARGIPWVEALVGVTLPSLFGDVVAIPIIAWLSWVRVGSAATLIASAGMVAGVAVGALVARQVGAVAEVAWIRYQPVAHLIEIGFRGRVELGVHLRSRVHRARLLQEVASWSAVERRAFVWAGVAGWSVPVVTALTAAALAWLTGADPLGLVERVVSHPSRSVVVAALLALTALPTLSSLSRGLAAWSKERSHFIALERFIQSTPARKQMVQAPALPSPSPLGAIRAERVRFSYAPRHSGEPPVVVQADLRWEANETLAICGANGCGKTTLTWLIMGIIEPESGTIEVEIGGAAQPPSALAGRVAYLPQQPYFEEVETVRDAIRFAAPDASAEETERLISMLLEGHFAGGVQALLERPIMSLSTGERRAVAIGRVLLRGSDIVILDEPEANLDGELRGRVMSALRQAKSRCRLLIVTHDEAFAAIADRVYRMRPDDARPEVKSGSAAE